MTPHHLHALAAAWSLHTARQHLARLAAEEAAQIAAQAEAAAEPLRSPSWGRRHALGGHGDPTADALGTLGRARPNRYAELQADVIGQLDGVARHLPGLGAIDPLWRIREHIPAMQPGTASAVTVLLAKLDGRVRRRLCLGTDRQLLRWVECPACRSRDLWVLTAGPEEAWTVVCVRPGGACLCTGQGCRCGQDGAVEGVAHIWRRAAVLGAVAGATPTQ